MNKTLEFTDHIFRAFALWCHWVTFTILAIAFLFACRSAWRKLAEKWRGK